MSAGNKDNVNTYLKKKKRWSDTEKRVLLRGLKRYGPDVGQLKILLQNKSENSIAQMIRRYEAIADLGKKDICSPLDVWLRSGIFDEGQYLVSEALLFIMTCENHPPPEECAGFDLNAAYKFLYEASKKRAASHVPRKTAEMLKELIVTVDKETWPANECSTTDYLINKLSTITESEKSYKNKRQID